MSLSNPLTITMIIFIVLGVAFLVLGILLLDRKKKKILTSLTCLLIAALMLSLSALFGTLTVAVRGYRELTREELAATVKIDPMGPQQFWAQVVLADGKKYQFDVSGDELYVDAHILKWKPWANLLGLHTSYELDRIAGRYTALADEATKRRTVYTLSSDKPYNMFDLRRKFAMLDPFLDAEYGSATFIKSGASEEFKVMVSTSGLLIRKTEKQPGQ